MSIESGVPATFRVPCGVTSAPGPNDESEHGPIKPEPFDGLTPQADDGPHVDSLVDIHAVGETPKKRDGLDGGGQLIAGHPISEPCTLDQGTQGANFCLQNPKLPYHSSPSTVYFTKTNVGCGGDIGPEENDVILGPTRDSAKMYGLRRRVMKKEWSVEQLGMLAFGLYMGVSLLAY